MDLTSARKFCREHNLQYNLDFWEIERGGRPVGACLSYPGAKKLAAEFNIGFHIDSWLATGEKGIWACHYIAKCGDVVLETTGYADVKDPSAVVKSYPARMAEKRAKVTLVMDMMLYLDKAKEAGLAFYDEETMNGDKDLSKIEEENLTTTESDQDPPKAAPADPGDKLLVMERIRKEKDMSPDKIKQLAVENYDTDNVRSLDLEQLDGFIQILEKYQREEVPGGANRARAN